MPKTSSFPKYLTLDNEDLVWFGKISSYAALGAMGIDSAIQNVEAFGVWAVATGSKLGLTQMDLGRLGNAALLGAAFGATVGAGLYLSDVYKRYQTEKKYQAHNTASDFNM